MFGKGRVISNHHKVLFAELPDTSCDCKQPEEEFFSFIKLNWDLIVALVLDHIYPRGSI